MSRKSTTVKGMQCERCGWNAYPSVIFRHPKTHEGLCPNCTFIADHETGLRGMLGPIPQPVPWYRRIFR